jgi:hypothetical protein
VDNIVVNQGVGRTCHLDIIAYLVQPIFITRKLDYSPMVVAVTVAEPKPDPM